MSLLQDEITKHIRKLIKPLKDDELLIPILKKRLTKKEYKLLYMLIEGIDRSSQMERLNLSLDRLEQLQEKMVKKLNQERLKQELMI